MGQNITQKKYVQNNAIHQDFLRINMLVLGLIWRYFSLLCVQNFIKNSKDIYDNEI